VGRRSSPAAARAAESSERRTLRRALVRLGRRDQSLSQLRRALGREGLDPNDVQRALQRLAERRLLDDRAFAERLSRRSLARGLGRKRIGLRLAECGVGRDDARAGLAQALELIAEEPVLERLARQYWSRHERVEPGLRARRLFAFLVRRGYTVASILRCTRQLFPAQAELVESLAMGD
jgi:SOS response regulatory protein OraA/RecX